MKAIVGVQAITRRQLVSLIIALSVLIGGCESDREELETSNSCVWCRLNDADLAGVSIRRLDLPHRIQLGINILMALSMLVVVALAAFASW